MLRIWMVLGVMCSMLSACDQVPAFGETPKHGSVSLGEQEKNLYGLAQNAQQAGDEVTAVSLYQQMISHSHGAVIGHIELAKIYRNLGRSQDSIDLLQQARGLQPENSEVLSELGYAFIAAKQPQSAIQMFDMALGKSDQNASAYNGRGVALDMMGDHKTAQRAYQKSRAIKPDQVSVINNLALSYILDKKPGEAIALLEPLANAPDSNATVRQNLALAYGILGDRDKAKVMAMRDLPTEKVEENLRFYRKYQVVSGVSTSPVSPAIPVDEVENTSFMTYTEEFGPNEGVEAVEPAAGDEEPPQDSE